MEKNDNIKEFLCWFIILVLGFWLSDENKNEVKK